MARRLTLIGAVLTSCAGPAVATPAAWASANTEVLVNEPFTGSSMSSPNWTVPSVPSGSTTTNVACLTAGTSTSEKPVPGCSSTPLDAPGNGALRLTPDAGNEEGGVAYGLSVPTVDGIDATFDSYQYGEAAGSAADGIGFFLAAADPTDPQPPVSIGQPGGSLGYSAHQGSSSVDPGMSYGYLGIGLDAYGNYTNKAFEGTGCTDQSWEATVRNNVSVRGPGNGTTGYCMESSTLSTHSTGLPAGSLDGGADGTRSAGSKVRVEVVINPSSSSVTSATYDVSVPADSYMVAFEPIGSSQYQTLVGTLPAAVGFPDGWVNPTTHIPYQLTFGWVGSTGGQKEVHEVNDVESATASGIPAALTTSMTDDAGGAPASGSTIDYHVTVANKPDTSTDSSPITVTDTLPSGETPSSSDLGGSGWSCAISGQKVSCTNDGPLAGGADLPDLVIPATVTASAGTQLTNSLVASSNDSDPTSGQGSVTVATPPTDTSTCDTAHGNGGWFASTPTCTVQGTDPNPGIDHVAYQLDGGSVVTTDSGTTTADVSITTDGIHTLKTQVFNSSGEGSGWSTRTLDVDTTAPDDTSTCGTPDGSSGWFVTDPTCTVKGSDSTSGVDHISYQLDDGTIVTTDSGTTTADVPITTDGTHTLKTKVYDAAGLSSEWRTETIHVLTARPPAPAVSSPAGGSLTKDVSPTVTVTGQPGDSVTVQVDGVDYGPVTLDASGDGHVQVRGPLSDGQHTVRAEQTDTAGNVSPWSATSMWTIKTSTSAQLSGPTGGPTGVTTPVIDYAGEPGDQFTITVDGHPIATGVIPVGGAGSLTVPTPLADGPHTIEITTTDAVGNTASRSIVVTVDTRAPEAPAGSGAPAHTDGPGMPRIVTAPGDLTASTRATFAFADSEPGVSYQCSLDGGAWKPCPRQATFSSLPQGPHTLQVRAVDSAGNVSPSAQDAWTVKRTPPPAPTILGGPSRYTVPSPTSFDISSEPGTALQCSLDGGGFKPCSRLVNLRRLRLGHHSLTVRQVDEAGNVSPRTTYRWTVLRRAGSRGLPRKAATLVARDTTAYGDRGLAVGCKLNAGSVRSCHVTALYHGRPVGQGMRMVAHRGHTSTVVAVRLNARGRRLLRQALGGLPITLRSAVKPFGFDRLPADAKTVAYAPLRILVPDVLFDFDSSTLTAGAQRIVRTIAADVQGARHVVCEGNTDSYEAAPTTRGSACAAPGRSARRCARSASTRRWGRSATATAARWPPTPPRPDGT